jgi:hypothetical protein
MEDVQATVEGGKDRHHHSSNVNASHRSDNTELKLSTSINNANTVSKL